MTLSTELEQAAREYSETFETKEDIADYHIEDAYKAGATKALEIIRGSGGVKIDRYYDWYEEGLQLDEDGDYVRYDDHIHTLDCFKLKIRELEEKFNNLDLVLIKIQNSVAMASCNENELFKELAIQMTTIIENARGAELTKADHG